MSPEVKVIVDEVLRGKRACEPLSVVDYWLPRLNKQWLDLGIKRPRQRDAGSLQADSLLLVMITAVDAHYRDTVAVLESRIAALEAGVAEAAPKPRGRPPKAKDE